MSIDVSLCQQKRGNMKKFRFNYGLDETIETQNRIMLC